MTALCLQFVCYRKTLVLFVVVDSEDSYWLVRSWSNSMWNVTCFLALFWAPFTRRENADIFTRFGLSFTRKRSFCHRKRSFLKTPAKVEISENTGYVLSCQRGETGFLVLKRHIMRQEMLNVIWAPYVYSLFVTGRRLCYSLLLILRILIGLHGFILLPTLPPIGLA